MQAARMAGYKLSTAHERKLMKFRKINEWEDHDNEPGGDAGFLLEAVDVPQDRPRYTLVSWSVLSDEEFDALERGEVIDLKAPSELTGRC